VKVAEHTQVWYDGNCGLCRRSRVWIEARCPAGTFRFRDFRSEIDAALPLTRDRMDASMLVADATGALLGGFAGWRRILSELPRWRWLAVVTGMPPLRWLGPPVYGLVARYRRLLAPAADTQRPGGSCSHSKSGRPIGKPWL